MITESYAYTAREWDRETGLYFCRARYYDPMEGRFISKDSIGFAGGDMVLYGYVHNDVINKVDPTGLETSDSRSCKYGRYIHCEGLSFLQKWFYKKSADEVAKRDLAESCENEKTGCMGCLTKDCEGAGHEKEYKYAEKKSNADFTKCMSNASPTR